MEKQQGNDAEDVDGAADDLLHPRYSPILDRATGLVVGAEAVAPSRSSATRLAARAFAFGPAAEEQWWVAAGLRPGQAARPEAPAVLGELLAATGLPAERLILPVTHRELIHAVETGTADAVGALGVRFTVMGFAAEAWSSAGLRDAPVASIQVSLAGLGTDPDDVALVATVVALAASCGTEVLGRDVDTAEQVALAADAEVSLVAGYWWGSPGSLAKLVGTWARPALSE